jgi:PAS domain S-box-containing protein
MADALERREGVLKAELSRSQRVQRQLLDAQRIGRIGSWEFDPATQLIEWSDEVYLIFGLEEGSFDGRLETVLQRVHPEDRARYIAARTQSLQAGCEFNIEHRIVTPQGDVRWLHQIGQNQKGMAGRPGRRFGVVQEITMRKNAELALTTSGDLLRRTGDMAKIGGWRLELPGMQLRCSEQIFRIHDRSAQGSLTFTEAAQAYLPGAREMFAAAVRAASEHGTPWDMELQMVTALGRAIWVRTQGEALIEAGRPVALVGALQDITTRKEAERAAVESDQRYNALFASAPIPMWLFEPVTLAFLAVNEAAIEAYGYSEAEFLQMTLFDIRPQSEHEALNRRLINGTPLHRSVWTHRRKNGVLFPVNVVSQPVQYAGQSARFSVVLDLTAQRKAEADMQDHLLTLQRAADAASAITYHLTLNEMMQEVAAQSRGVIGTQQALVALAAGAIDSQPLRALSASSSHRPQWEAVDFVAIREFCAPVFESNRSMRLSQDDIAAHFANAPRLGERLPLMHGCLAVPLTGRSGDNIGVLLLTDKYDQAVFTQQDEYVCIELARLVSVAMENAQLLDELSQLNADLEEKVRQRTAALRLSNQELEAFSYSVSHDLRSPLNTIDGFSRLLSKQLPSDASDKARHYLARIHAGVGQMGQLIEDLLSLAQVSRVQLRHEPVDLSLLAAQAVQNLQAGNPARQVTVHIESGLQAHGDARLIRVVMENLVGNAWKFSSLRSDPEITVGQTRNADGKTVFSVRDNGAGFDMAYADKLYQAFQRLHTVSEFPGTGVGLATVHRIVSRHGGELWAESKVGKGAAFFFTLPKTSILL